MMPFNHLKVKQELVIGFTGSCNNNCIFCNINKKGVISYENILRKIAKSKKGERIIFNGSEPTIQPRFLDLASLAKDKFNIVQLDTNGRTLADLDFAKKIIKSGVNHFKISLCGHRPSVHDRRTGTPNSFKETILGINNLVKLGQKDNIILNIPVISHHESRFSNFFKLNGIIRIAKNLGIRKIHLDLFNPIGEIDSSIDEVAECISKARYVFLFDVLIKVSGLPYCLIPEPEGVIVKSDRPNDFIKLKKCKKCRYNQACDGILRGYLNNINEEKIIPKTLPKEIMIEITSRCNFKCKFCFNRASFAKKEYNYKQLSTAYIKKVIDKIKKNGVPVVRFTGGEPMLHKDIFELLRYAKSKGLQVRLNTNGSLIKNYKMVKEMVKYLDYILFSMHTYDSQKDEVLTGFKGSFKKKIRVIKWFKRAGIKTIRISTISTLDNIKNLEKFYILFKKMKIDKWATNRMIPLPGEKKSWGEKELPLLVNKLIKIKKDIVKNRLSLKVHIVNAVPLCASDPIKMNAVCAGARSVDGHERFVVDPRGFAKPIYYIDKKIGDPLNILACWNHPFMRLLRSYKKLPKNCQRCFLLDKCKGGNRYCAYVAGKNYRAEDPLMDHSNIKKLTW